MRECRCDDQVHVSVTSPPPGGGPPDDFQNRCQTDEPGGRISPLVAPSMTFSRRRRTSHDPAKPRGTSTARVVPTTAAACPLPPEPPEPATCPVTEALGDGLVRALGKELDGVGVRVTPGVALWAGVIVAVGVGVAEWCTTVLVPELLRSCRSSCRCSPGACRRRCCRRPSAQRP